LPLASELPSFLFADDTMLLKSGPNINELTDLVNAEFQKIVQYFRANKLALHPNKTQFLLFTHSQAAKENPPEIYINNNDVGTLQDPSKLIAIPNINAKSSVPAVKFLGIFIDPALNFKYHVEKMTRKLATALFFMRNAKHFLNVESMRSLYYSIFHSVVVYGIHVWSSTANTNLQGIILKQKAAVRTIHVVPDTTITQSLSSKPKKFYRLGTSWISLHSSLSSNINKDSFHPSSTRPGHLHPLEELMISI
jgi:hypothetical protein